MPEINLVVIGVLLIFLGFALVFIGALSGKDSKVAVGGIIGFIPFGFGNDPELVKLVIITAVILAMVFILLVLKGII